MQPNVYAVANFHCDKAVSYYEDLFRRFDQKVARRLLGRRYHEKRSIERPYWVAFPERATYIHYNLVGRIPPEYLDQYLDISAGVWEKLVPRGDFRAQSVVPTEKDYARIAGYITKAFSPTTTIDRAILSSRFWPRHCRPLR
jgi:hypothetical protein